MARDQELAAISALLRREDVRLLTLTGTGGVGKTRLAIAVANSVTSDFPDGAAFVALAPVRSADLVASAISHILGVVESGDEPDLGPLVAALRGAAMLLVLDNFEHVVTAAPLVVELLVGCPRVTVLVTSRAALHVTGEREYPVLPLPLPASDTPLPEHIARAPAVRLFVDRAAAVDPSFTLTDDNAAAIAAICRRLDGLPLAIELAAARSKVLSPALLLPRLARRLPLLTGGPRDVPARLQTMQEAIGWSHELLTPEDQVLFRRLAVFVGGFTLDAAETVCCCISETIDPARTPAASVLDGIASLVDKSLLQVSERGAGGQRLGMLETIREFALERLDAAGEGEVTRAAHAAYVIAFSEEGYPNHFGPFADIDRRFEHLEAEMPNVRAAFAHLADVGDAEGVLRLAGALAVFWQLRGHFREGRQWLEWGLSHTAEAQTDARCRALVGLGLLRWAQGDFEQAASLVRAALTIAEQIDDTEIIAHAIHVLGLVAEAQRAWDEAERLFEQVLGLWRALEAWAEEAVALVLLSGVAFSRGDRDLAAQHAEASLTRFRGLGYASGTGLALCRLAQLARERGDDHDAALTYDEALQLWAGVRDRWFITLALAGLAELAGAYEQAQSAATILGSIDALAEATGAPLFHTARINSDRAATAAHTALGAERFAEFRAAGHQLRLDDAIALALAISVPDPTSINTAGLHSLPRTHGLTRREHDVLRLLIAGQTDREIAAALYIGHRTVEDHVSNIIGKLGVANRTEAVAVAVRDTLV